MPTGPETWMAEKLARRKALRQVVIAVWQLTQPDKGGDDLIRRREVLDTISKWEPNGLEWGSIHYEVGPVRVGTPTNIWGR